MRPYSPVCPAQMDWSSYYPAFTAPDRMIGVGETPSIYIDTQGIWPLFKDVEVADIGCGFGGLLVALGPRLPDKLLLG